ncbi:hypothetical protein EDB86DRAFT_436119 [Lactarius hatsudake]|nr:hypothetical protein EDB86DRAFT_436119 [Lactarius hatsudake]
MHQLIVSSSASHSINLATLSTKYRSSLPSRSKYALNYLCLRFQSGSELKKDPGARLHDLKVSTVPFIPLTDLAIGPFGSVSAIEPVLRGCNDGVWHYTLVARVASEAPSAASVPASSRSSCGRSIVRPVSLPPYCIMLLMLSAHGTAGCRSRPVEEDREAMGKRFSSRSTRSVCAFRIPPSWVGLVMRENAHTWLKHLRPLTLTLRSRSPARAGGADGRIILAGM